MKVTKLHSLLDILNKDKLKTGLDIFINDES